MTTKPQAITPATLGAWLIKGSRTATPIEELLRTGFSTVTGWCVRPTYRLDLVRSGQPVLFWLSGGDASYPAGIYARGTTTGPATPSSGTLVLPVRLEPVDSPVLRSELRSDPVLSRVEVLTMPAGSNPSFMTCDQLAALEARGVSATQRAADTHPTHVRAAGLASSRAAGIGRPHRSQTP